jgi:hypothetical protein
MIVGFNTSSVDQIPQPQMEGSGTAAERHSLKFEFHLLERLEATLEPHCLGAASSRSTKTEERIGNRPSLEKTSLLRGTLNQLDFVTFGRVYECDRVTLLRAMRSVGKWIAFRCRFARELIQIVDFESQVREVRPDDNRTTGVEFAKLDLFFALLCLQKDELRTATGRVPADFFQSEDILVKGYGFFQISDTISSVEKFFYHHVFYCPGPQ